MGLLLLCPIRPRLHRIVCCQHGRKGLYPVGGHVCGTERWWSDDGGEGASLWSFAGQCAHAHGRGRRCGESSMEAGATGEARLEAGRV
jgi:hypothetical protein